MMVNITHNIYPLKIILLSLLELKLRMPINDKGIHLIEESFKVKYCCAPESPAMKVQL